MTSDQPSSVSVPTSETSCESPGAPKELVTATVVEFPKCDFCSFRARYDGKTTQGPWAYMCGGHFLTDGVGLGMGRGQRLILATEKDE